MLVPSGVFAVAAHVPVTLAAMAVAALNVIANPAHIESNFLIGPSRAIFPANPSYRGNVKSEQAPTITIHSRSLASASQFLGP
jgi:hypothetical protein